ncbi:MAG: hypothetical protein B6U73_04640 [Desulfurococcales archaeon ex4484_204]|nr:MAG: hypothetical protein B6U73_04640 [Desulfurococcales archaeon ex4484_204]
MKPPNSFRFGEWEVRLLDTTPRIVVIEPTTRCNFKCIHCFRNEMGEEFKDMEYDFFLNLVDSIRGLGIKRITFTGWGEPTIHPRILDMVAEARRVASEIVLNTNGSTLLRIAEDLVNIGVDELLVSIDSPDIATYSKIRVGGELSIIAKGLLKLRELRLKKGYVKPAVSVIFTINTLNYSDVVAVAEFSRRAGVNRVIYNNFIPTSRKLEGLACYTSSKCSREVSKLIGEVSRLSMDGTLAVQATYRTVKSYFFCPYIDNSAVYVARDGWVSPCMFFAHSWTPTLYGIERAVRRVVFGNVCRESLLDIWRKREYVLFRFLVRARQMPSCLDCELAPYCTYTLSNQHDCLGNSPSCASCPYARNLAFCPV